MNYDAVVVGAGPNGLAAAITLVQAGCSVIVFEAKDTVGGGMRSAELTLPGFVHDICSAIHPLAAASPFFRPLLLEELGLEWIYPPAAMAHPFDDGSAIVLEKSIEATAASLKPDATAYSRLLSPLVRDWEKIEANLLGPLRLPDDPLALARFGWYALHSLKGLVKNRFKDERTSTFLGGLAAHSILPLEKPVSAAIALVLAILAHRVGWPLPRGGSQKIADTLALYLQKTGVEIMTGKTIQDLNELPPARAIFCDISPQQLLALAGNRLPKIYRQRLQRYRYGPGVFKMDWALSEPIPFTARNCAQAGTVHLGGTLDEICHSERSVWKDTHPERPFVILAQPSLFDQTRAPDEYHTAWAYCHAPNGSTVDMSERIENQIERFAPGFRDCILSKHVMTTKDFQQYNANYIGGDINGGAQDIRQLFTRPVARLNPYSTPVKGLYICSASTPPGGGVHGMCGYHAAGAALKSILSKE